VVRRRFRSEKIETRPIKRRGGVDSLCAGDNEGVWLSLVPKGTKAGTGKYRGRGQSRLILWIAGFLTVLGVSLVFAAGGSERVLSMKGSLGNVKKVEVGDQKDLVVSTRPSGVGWMIQAGRRLKMNRFRLMDSPRERLSRSRDVLYRPVIFERGGGGAVLDYPILEGRRAMKGSD